MVAVNDDLVFPDRVYLVVTHAASAATYEALLAWSPRGEDRELPRERWPARARQNLMRMPPYAETGAPKTSLRRSVSAIGSPALATPCGSKKVPNSA